jgi:hypothetical protein
VEVLEVLEVVLEAVCKIADMVGQIASATVVSAIPDLISLDLILSSSSSEKPIVADVQDSAQRPGAQVPES